MRFLERKDAIHALRLAVASRRHLLIVGPPGTAKTALIREFARKSGLTVFTHLLTAFTTPEEIFGPIDVAELRRSGRIRRLTDGFLPSAQLVFLDEVFKANSAILNALLAAMQERIYMAEPPHEAPIPLITLVGASNEIPDGSGELAAVYDRFLLRVVVDYVGTTREKVVALLSGEGDEIEPVDLSAIPSPDDVAVPADVVETAASIVMQVRQEGIIPSDRRVVESMQVVRAAAALEGRTGATVHDLLALRFTLWNHPREVQKVETIVVNTVSPELAEARALMAEVEKAYVNVTPTDAQKVAQFLASVNTTRERLKRLAVTAGPYRATVEGYIRTLNEMARQAAQTLVGGES